MVASHQLKSMVMAEMVQLVGVGLLVGGSHGAPVIKLRNLVSLGQFGAVLLVYEAWCFLQCVC